MGLSDNMREMLCSILEQSTKVASWGITNIQIENCQLSMDVDAMKYKGPISVNPSNKDCVIVNIGERTIECKFDEVVDLLDTEIEMTEDYQYDLAIWLQSKS